jgi:glutamate racemase
MDKRAIGVFDSGVGGLTVLREIIEQMPFEDIIYFGDTARIPYGTKSSQTVVKYSNQNARFLSKYDIKTIVVACNTASSVALKDLEKNFDIPVIGVIDPGAEAAVEKTKNNKVGVIGTTATVRSSAYQDKIRELNPEISVIGNPCPLFVQIVEEGWEDSDVAELTARKYLIELMEHEIDALVLGCTHYPLLRYTLNKVLGDSVKLINPAYETAKALKEMLTEKNMLKKSSRSPVRKFFVSDAPEKFRRIGGNILNMEITDIEEVEIEKY